MRTLILGGGLAGLSVAHFLNGESLILEAQNQPGGLCRSFPFKNTHFDVGPHIIFSKNKQALDFLNSLAPTCEHKRSNKVFYNGKLIKYPFENELSALPENERELCLQEFLHNPYRTYAAGNMLQFFLKIFGEGITRLYLQPYNEKIWKFDPAFMDTQMVDRIPRPPDEDIIKSAQGVSTEGYLHQLYFRYPETGGIESLVSGLAGKLGGKSKIQLSSPVKTIAKTGKGWRVETGGGVFDGDRIINCMPVHELLKCLPAPANIAQSAGALKYNSIHIAVIHAKKDNIGDNFAVNCADKNIIFHRLSKLSFMGGGYVPTDGGSFIMAEVTFRPESQLSKLSSDAVLEKVLEGLDSTGLVLRRDIVDSVIKTFKYAYVIYDLNHRTSADTVLSYLRNLGIESCGRFAECEYLNMDAVVERAMKLAAKLNGELK